MKLNAALLSAAILTLTPVSADEPESMIAFYKSTPATLLDVFIEATNRNLNHVASVNSQAFLTRITTQDSRGEAYRGTLPQRELDLYHLTGRFRAKPGDRFAVIWTAAISPYHSILQDGLEDEEICRAFLSKMTKEAQVNTNGMFYASHDGLNAVDLHSLRKRDFLVELRQKTQLTVEWLLTPGELSGDFAGKAAKSLGAKGVAVRLYSAKCQQVTPLGEEPKDILIDFQDFGSLRQFFEWKEEIARKDAELQLHEEQEALNQRVK
jgi:hypothetical protein